MTNICDFCCHYQAYKQLHLLPEVLHNNNPIDICLHCYDKGLAYISPRTNKSTFLVIKETNHIWAVNKYKLHYNKLIITSSSFPLDDSFYFTKKEATTRLNEIITTLSVKNAYSIVTIHDLKRMVIKKTLLDY